MRLHRTPLTLVLTAALTMAGAAATQAQAVDLTGAWTLTVMTDQGTANPTVTLAQDGENLTGHYSSEALGEADVTGTVKGQEVTFSFNASLQGQSIPVVYKGTLDAEGKLSGTLDLAGGMATGTFTAVRASR